MTVLGGRAPTPAGVSLSLRDEYWRIVYPGFDDKRHALPPDALTCTGRALLREPAFHDTQIGRDLTDAQITRGGGADGIKAVWLRSHQAADGKVAGAVALVRVRGDLAYVVGVGAYRGSDKARLSIDRMGDELVLLVLDDGCTNAAPDKACVSTQSVFLVRQGRLVEAARLALEQVDFDVGTEPVAVGRLRYHLTASPSFVKDTLHVVEHVSVQDASGRELRWAEVERVFQVLGDTLEPSDQPLWSRLFRPETASR